MVHDANREHKIKRSWFEWQLLQISLREIDVVQVRTQLGGFVNRVRVVCSDDVAAGFGHDLAVPPSSAAGIQNSEPLQLGKFNAGLGRKRYPVFVVVGDFVFVPLQPKALQVF